jgi:hypothetical protein
MTDLNQKRDKLERDIKLLTQNEDTENQLAEFLKRGRGRTAAQYEYYLKKISKEYPPKFRK